MVVIVVEMMMIMEMIEDVLAVVHLIVVHGLVVAVANVQKRNHLVVDIVVVIQVVKVHPDASIKVIQVIQMIQVAIVIENVIEQNQNHQMIRRVSVHHHHQNHLNDFYACV